MRQDERRDFLKARMTRIARVDRLTPSPMRL